MGKPKRAAIAPAPEFPEVSMGIPGASHSMGKRKRAATAPAPEFPEVSMGIPGASGEEEATDATEKAEPAPEFPEVSMDIPGASGEEEATDAAEKADEEADEKEEEGEDDAADADDDEEEEEEDQKNAEELPAPNGWIKRKVASKCDGKQIIRNTFISPTGYLFKSRNQLRRYLEAHPGPPLLAFDWRTIENPIGVVRHKNDFNGFKYLLNSIPAGVIDIPISVTLPLQRKIYKYGKKHSFQFSEETACRLSTVFQEINDREIDGNSAVVYVRTPRELKKILKFRKRNEIANFKLHIPEDVERGQRLYRLGKKEGFEFDDATAFRLAK